MITASQDGVLIVWDTNKLTYLNSVQTSGGLDEPISKVCISETTNEFAFIAGLVSTNKLHFYTGNCDLIGTVHASQLNGDTATANQQVSESNSSSQRVTMKSLCFSNATEGLSVNVIAVGLSNGHIRLLSTWDLSVLRDIRIAYDAHTSVGCIIALCYARDSQRLYAADTYSRVYILEAGDSMASLAKQQQSQQQQQTVVVASSAANLSSSTLISGSSASIYLTNFISFT